MKKVLVLDDKQDILEMLEVALMYEQFEVHSMSNDDDIFAIAGNFRPDLILMDYRLGHLNGGEICWQFKTHPSFNSVPVIIFSAYVQKNIDYSQYKCDAVIEKPFDLDVLTSKIHQLINASLN